MAKCNPYVKFAFAVCIVGLLVWFGGCGQEDAAPTQQVMSSTPGGNVQRLDGTVIGVSLLTRTHQFYQELEENLVTEAKRYGMEVLIESAEFDPNKQVDQIDTFVTRGVDAIVICPCDTESIGVTIAKVNEAKIPVFTADIAAADGDVVCHIASDNVQGGRLAAGAMVEALGTEGGKIVIIDDPTRSSVTERVTGFLEILESHPEIEILARQSGVGRRETSHDVMENLLQANPKIDGVFAINDETALGALAAIESAGRKGEMVIIGYDGAPEARRRIDAGDIYADSVQYPGKIGRQTVSAIADYLNGESVPRVHPVECGLYESPAAKNAKK